MWWTLISSAVASQQKPPALEQIPQQGWHVSLERKDDLEMKESAASPERGQVKWSMDRMDEEFEEARPLALLRHVLL